MGLFDKKICKCKRCGKEYEARLDSGYCSDCFNNLCELEAKHPGFENYINDVYFNDYNLDKFAIFEAIPEHNQKIINDHKGTAEQWESVISEILKAEPPLTEEEESLKSDAIGATEIEPYINFAIAGIDLGCLDERYDEVLLNFNDIFAITISEIPRANLKFMSKTKVSNYDLYLALAFTNDSLVPVFPMVFMSKKGMFEISKSKKGRASTNAILEIFCPNLTYEIKNFKEFKNEIENANEIKGNLTKDFILKQLDAAYGESHIYKAKKIFERLDKNTGLVAIGYKTMEIFKEIGFHTKDYYNDLFKPESFFKKLSKNLFQSSENKE